MDPTRNQPFKVMTPAHGQTSSGSAPVQPLYGVTALGAFPSNQALEHMDTYDPARISQWAAHSATGPSVMQDLEPSEPGSFSYENEIASARIASQIPEHFPEFQSDAFHSFQFGPSHVPFDLGMNLEEPSTTSVGGDFTGLHMGHEGIPGLGFGFPSTLDCAPYAIGLSSSIDDQAYSAIAPGDLSFDPVESHSLMLAGNNNHGLDFSSSWPTSGADITEPLDWSPASALTPSSSSMQTSDSRLGHQPDTPVSAIPHEGLFTMNQNGPLEGEIDMSPSFNFTDAMLPQSLIGHIDPERFALNKETLANCHPNVQVSTIRPSQNFQRAPLSMDVCAGQDTAGHPYGIPLMYQGINGSRRSSEGEAKVARDHAFYSAEPKEDGLYHCPYAATENCTHKPEKLKCNYHKHLDSHLKPYRCKWSTCSQIQFSSTACLLRHEREAHGMHGHGPKPYLCKFKDCDRAQENNGFPRSWNLKDHMKRVHDYVATEPSNKSNSPSPSSTSSVDLPRKKRTPSPSLEGISKKIKTTAAGRSMEYNTGPQMTIQGGTPHTVLGYQPQSLNQIWYDRITQLQTRLRGLDPTDPRQWMQYQADAKALHDIGLSMQSHRQA